MQANITPFPNEQAHTESLSKEPGAESPVVKNVLSVEELRRDKSLWYKLHIFMYDLRNYRSNNDARSRLDCVVNEYYVGLPYFTEDEAQKLLHTTTDILKGETLGDAIKTFCTAKLEHRIKNRMKETGDYRVCAAHDLAPIFERAFRVNTKDLSKNKGFMRLMGKGGLQAVENGEVWKGLGK